MADIDQTVRAALRTVAEEGQRGSRGSSHGYESAAALRRISERRQTRQRAFAATALVVVAVLVGGGILLNRPSTKSIVPGQSNQPTPTSPAPTVAAQSMLTAADLPDSIIALSNPYPGPVVADTRSTPAWTCAPAPTVGAPARTAAFRTASATEGTWIDQRVESFKDASAAAAAMDALTQRFTSCATSTSGVTLDQSASETGLGNAAVVLTATLPSAADVHAVHSLWLEVARTGRVVTWVGLEYYTQDLWPAQDVALRRAVSKLCSLGGGGCVTEPVVRTTTYAYGLPQVDPSSLTPELLAASLGSGWTPAVDETLDPPYACADTVSDPTGPSTPGVVIRAWASDLVDTYGAKILRSNVAAGEVTRPYATAQAASAAVHALTNAFDACTSPVTQRVGGGLVWRQADGQTWFAFGTKGTDVVTLEVRANGAATFETAAQVNALMDAALGRLPYRD